MVISAAQQYFCFSFKAYVRIVLVHPLEVNHGFNQWDMHGHNVLVPDGSTCRPVHNLQFPSSCHGGLQSSRWWNFHQPESLCKDDAERCPQQVNKNIWHKQEIVLVALSQWFRGVVYHCSIILGYPVGCFALIFEAFYLSCTEMTPDYRMIWLDICHPFRPQKPCDCTFTLFEFHVYSFQKNESSVEEGNLREKRTFFQSTW